MSGAQQLVLTPPDVFSFVATEFESWMQRFERFRTISGLKDLGEDVQISTLIYTMGPQAEDIFKSLKLSAAAAAKYNDVKAAFEKFFVPKVNIVYERARFNQRFQEPGEAIETFIADLYTIAEKCKLGDLKEEFIRDRIVVGILDGKLSEKMQLDEKLTLETAIKMAKQSELVHAQQSTVRKQTESKVDVGAISKNPNRFSKAAVANTNYNAGQKKDSSQASFGGKPCSRCGHTKHTGKQCPALKATCNNCKKVGHYSKCCKSSKTPKNNVGCVQTNFSQDKSAQSFSPVFLGHIDADSKPWAVLVGVGSANKDNIVFTIDSGAAVTCLPSSEYKTEWGTLEKVSRPIMGPNGDLLSVSGKVNTVLWCNNKKCNAVVHFIDRLQHPLLGRPELRELDILKVLCAQPMQVNSVASQEKLKWTTKFPELFNGLGKLQCNYKITMLDGACPFACCVPRKVSIPILPKVKKALSQMCDQDILEKVEGPSEWCAPMVVVNKPSGDVRITTDFTELNKAVQREYFEMPSVDFALGQLGGAKVFSKLDANSGFYQIPLDESSRYFTTFITPFGRYCYRRLPMGISSAPEVYSKAMSDVLNGMEGASNLMDDICVYGRSKQEHDRRLEAVMQKLLKSGVTLNHAKCIFGVSELKYLGFIVGKDGVRPDPDKVMAITKFPTPTGISDLRRFLGMVNNLARFVPHLATLTSPLRELLKSTVDWIWDEPQSSAFENLKKLLVSPEVLLLYDPKLETKIAADSSSFGLGAVLLQKSGQIWRPVSYISRSLTPTESRYATIEKEALAVTWACERFSQFLFGKPFLVETDHSPLVSLLSKKRIDELPIRIQRFRLRLLRYSYSVVYVPGKRQLTADALSRAPVLVPLDECAIELNAVTQEYADGIIQSFPATEKRLEEIRQKQNADDTVRHVKDFCQSEWPSRVPSSMKAYYAVRNDLTVVKDLLCRGSRLVIPPSMYVDILHKLHEGHQGIVKCQQLARTSVWWPGVTGDIKTMVTKCNVCIPHRDNRAEPMISTPLPDRPWQLLGADLFHFQGKNYLLVVDYFSRYVEMALLTSTNSASVKSHMCSFFARHGVPEELISDGGPPFNSKEFRLFCEEYNFHHTFSSPRYAQGNGEAERAVQTVKNLLKKAVSAGADLYLALLSYRNTPMECGFSPSQLLMGRRLRSPLPILPDALKPEWPPLDTFRKREEESRVKIKENYDRRHGVRSLPPLKVNQRAHVKGLGDATVVKPSGHRSYIFKKDNGATYRRNRRFAIVYPPSTPVPSATPNVPNLQPADPGTSGLRRSERSTQGKVPERYRSCC